MCLGLLVHLEGRQEDQELKVILSADYLRLNLQTNMKLIPFALPILDLKTHVECSSLIEYLVSIHNQALGNILGGLPAMKYWFVRTSCGWTLYCNINKQP